MRFTIIVFATVIGLVMSGLVRRSTNLDGTRQLMAESHDSNHSPGPSDPAHDSSNDSDETNESTADPALWKSKRSESNSNANTKDDSSNEDDENELTSSGGDQVIPKDKIVKRAFSSNSEESYTSLESDEETTKRSTTMR
ncbi:hypothetical protein DICVIV_04736 [Dictyocaulus viviparus]|uniref:Uncharacterized protein n=1 Tax=Dictyocaulus viviparus TaxID=29172 RepID=A0A0D8Y3E5_DICVI|nr:hypothetical protein DICVIV_04736 [Dictyocaulus viviparus]